jgi:tetratricopeptide (TPR) repeat protein
MERLINVFGDTGGEFLFDAHYVIGQAEDTYKNYAKAADHYNQALINSSWHENANDARIRQGDALYKVGLATKSQSAFELAYSSFEAVRGDTEAKLELRARCSFRMGECKIKQKDHRGAGFLFLETTLNFPSAVEWVPKAFEQAITCYQQTGQTDQITLVNAQYVAWQRKFLK